MAEIVVWANAIYSDAIVKEDADIIPITIAGPKHDDYLKKVSMLKLFGLNHFKYDLLLFYIYPARGYQWLYQI